jgi:hypothetical protein
MGTEEPQVLTLVDGLWAEDQRVSLEKNISMAFTFSAQDLDEVLAQTKTETAPCLDGRYVSNVSIIFYAPCLFMHHLLYVLLHFVAFLCIFWN